MSLKPISSQTGRPVRITSLSFIDQPLDTVTKLVDQEASKGVDLIALPETWPGQKKNAPETLEGPVIAKMVALAKKHHTYIVCPIDRQAGEQRLNSAVLLDRQGEIVCIYDKVYPYWEEFDLMPAVDIGTTCLQTTLTKPFRFYMAIANNRCHINVAPQGQRVIA
ncbi:MAG: carbon-nitrogen hydrolase family protein [Chloroflexota bacterium]